MTPLWRSLTPCGPLLDPSAAAHVRETLADAARRHRWTRAFDEVWPALAPIVSASPYLGGLARRNPAWAAETLLADPDERLRDLLTRARRAGVGTASGPEAAGGQLSVLRQLKAQVHLLTALADLGAVWPLEKVTAALSEFADSAVAATMRLAAAEAAAAGTISRMGMGAEGPIPGLFCVAMGKLGAYELNYSSDIDISFFHEPTVLPLAAGVEAGRFASRLVERVAAMLEARDTDGYVFRVDMRLRPDPASTPPAVPLPLAYRYYETVGQNWERAAFIKARVAAGDFARGREFIAALLPFVWRRNLDFAAIADIHSIRRQIQLGKTGEPLAARGADLKLGLGGIREIEFYVQTQQLILGGRQPDLRSSATLEALSALARLGHVPNEAAKALAQAYRTLRGLEHRAQMVADEQTHLLPKSDPERRRIAVLAGYSTLRRFDADVTKILREVNRLSSGLFSGEELPRSKFGNLVFTGVDDDPETLATLARMGFSAPSEVSGVIRGWRHGRIGATRSERGRELFTRLAPRLLEAARATGAPDAAFSRFADFFAGLANGVQVQSLFLAQQRLFELLLKIMALAPKFARTLAKRPSALDAMLDPDFFAPLEPAKIDASDIAAGGTFEESMDLARRAFRERSLRVAVHILSGLADSAMAGGAFADLADALVEGLALAAMAEVERIAGPIHGEVAVIALGKCGSREMTATSDLDLMTIYRIPGNGVASAIKGWSADTFYARFTQRLVTALASPTVEGELYAVDLQLRPSGTAGPVAVSLAAFESYYSGEAEAWELMALTRARVIWASSPEFGKAARMVVETALRQPRDLHRMVREIAEMRALMARERPPEGFWDMKLSEGGLVDIEFCAQWLQLLHAASGGPLTQNTGEALKAFQAEGLASPAYIRPLEEAWRLQQELSQLLKVAVDDTADPSTETPGLRALLVKAGDARGLAGLKATVRQSRRSAHRVFKALISDPSARHTLLVEHR